MREEIKTKAGAGIIKLVLVVLLMMPVAVKAGNLEPSGPPDNGTMHTLEDIYNLVANNGVAPVEKTGQTASYATGDDGDHEKGVAWPIPRFTDNADGTVTDNLTGLIWLKNASCFGSPTWATAITDCNTLNSGECGLTDVSVEGDWRLPNRKELFSLVDAKHHSPALPSGHPFTSVVTSFYWSGTSVAFRPANFAWYVLMLNGDLAFWEKIYPGYVWPVRGGND